MKPVTFSPCGSLSPFVECFWSLQDYRSAHSREISIPDGSAELVIDLGGGPIRLFNRNGESLLFGASVLCGPHTEYFGIDTSGQTDVVGIHFRPGGLFPFLPVPLHELLNRHVPLSAYWPHEARLIRRLAAGSTLEERFRTLEEELLASSCRPLERHPAVVYALEELRRSSVAKVLEQTGLSHRRFNERFKAQVGMTPKQLSRLYRFQEVLSALNQGEQPDWASIAEACGYCDQAHLIRDFQAFSGMPPSRYRRIPERHPNHSPYPR